MSIELLHRISIAAPAERIYQAITTEDGIRGWWTTDVAMHERVNGRAMFGFENHSVTLKMQIEQLQSPSLVRWRCDGGNSPEWIGTTLEFRLASQPDGEMLLKFCHSGWNSATDYVYQCNTIWGHLLVTLKGFVETGVKNPYFKDGE